MLFDKSKAHFVQPIEVSRLELGHLHILNRFVNWSDSSRGEEIDLES
jgi:hypothetical protein